MSKLFSWVNKFDGGIRKTAKEKAPAGAPTPTRANEKKSIKL